MVVKYCKAERTANSLLYNDLKQSSLYLHLNKHYATESSICRGIQRFGMRILLYMLNVPHFIITK